MIIMLWWLYLAQSTRRKMQEAKRTSVMVQAVLLLLLVLVLTGYAQTLPPAKYDGFLFEHRRVDPDSILIEAFFDPVCPDSRDSWPPLKQALAYYGPNVTLAVHLLPLPYHDNAFVSSRAIHIINQLKPSATFSVLEWFFKNQPFGFRNFMEFPFCDAFLYWHFLLYFEESILTCVLKEVLLYFQQNGAFLLPACCDPFNEKATRASRGASFQLPIVSGTWNHLESLISSFQIKILAGRPETDTKLKPFLLFPSTCRLSCKSATLLGFG